MIEEIKEESMMDNVLKEDVDKPKEEEVENKIQPTIIIADYKRKYSFENVINSLNRVQRAEIAKLISDREREKFLGIIYKIPSQLEYFKLFDKEYELLLKKKENIEDGVNKILEDAEFELRQFDVVVRFLMNSLNDWLDMKGYLSKQLTPQDWMNYTKVAYDKYSQEAEDNAVIRIKKYKEELEQKIIKTNYLFYDYYETFIKDKPLS